MRYENEIKGRISAYTEVLSWLKVYKSSQTKWELVTRLRERIAELKWVMEE